MKKVNCSLYETFNYGMGYVCNIHAASTKFLSCWLHHKLRLQRPMAARNHYRRLQYDSYEHLLVPQELLYYLNQEYL